MSTNKVVGVSYSPEDGTPSVILKGAGADADSLLAQARRRDDLPVVHAPTLTEHLYRTPLDTPVAKELFPVMAALLAHVLHTDRLNRESQQ
jgi:type III secretion system FlhB-like substrate exporter